ncbi:hypothetical protein TB1_040399 [Malus domestica]
MVVQSPFVMAGSAKHIPRGWILTTSSQGVKGGFKKRDSREINRSVAEDQDDRFFTRPILGHYGLSFRFSRLSVRRFIFIFADYDGKIHSTFHTKIESSILILFFSHFRKNQHIFHCAH